MSKEDGVLPCFGPLFAFRWLLFDYRKAGNRRPDPTFGPARRFSARLGRPHRCAKLGQKIGHRSAYLLRRHRTLLFFPRTRDGLPQIMSQPELLTGTRHDPVPSFHLLRRAHPHLIPEQRLFEQAIAMLVRKAALVPATHLLQRWLFVIRPNKPAFLWVALATTGRLSLHTQHTHLGLHRFLKMQVLPTRDDHALALLIFAFPASIGSLKRFGPRAVQQGAMLA